MTVHSLVVQLLPDQIEIRLEFRRSPAVHGSVRRKVEAQGDGLPDRGGAAGEDDDPVRQGDGLGEIVGHQDGGFLLPADDLADVVSHVEPGLVVQGGEGFIQEEKVRFQHQGADKGRPLAHAAGELRGAGAGEGLKAIDVQKLISLLPGPGGEHVLDLQAQDHVVVDGAPFKQFVVLQHIAYVGGAFPLIFPVDLDQPPFRGQEAGDDGQEGGFAAAGRAYDGHELPFLKGKGDVGEGGGLPLQGVIGVTDMFQFQNFFHGNLR